MGFYFWLRPVRADCSPCNSQFPNIVSSQVFHTDLLTSSSAPFLGGDSATALGDWPFMTVFNLTTSMQRFLILSLVTTHENVTVAWQSTLGGIYSFKISPDLNSWTMLSSRLVAAGMSSL